MLSRFLQPDEAFEKKGLAVSATRVAYLVLFLTSTRGHSGHLSLCLLRLLSGRPIVGRASPQYPLSCSLQKGGLGEGGSLPLQPRRPPICPSRGGSSQIKPSYRIHHLSYPLPHSLYGCRASSVLNLESMSIADPGPFHGPVLCLGPRDWPREIW